MRAALSPGNPLLLTRRGSLMRKGDQLFTSLAVLPSSLHDKCQSGHRTVPCWSAVASPGRLFGHRSAGALDAQILPADPLFQLVFFTVGRWTRRSRQKSMYESDARLSLPVTC